MEILHSAVMAIMRAADVGMDSPDMIMKIKLWVKCQSVCAIEGLYEGRGALANLVNSAAPAVNYLNAVVLIVPLIHDY
jgi:hypothetical protein